MVLNDAPVGDIPELREFDNVVVSPGPGHPSEPRDFGIAARVIAEAEIPVLGVCLGHQGIAVGERADVEPAPWPRHGHLSTVRHDGRDLFHGLPQNFTVVRYHSLSVREPLPPTLEATAWSEDGVLMGLRHRERPLWGVQFHPESILTDHGHRLLINFRNLTAERAGSPRTKNTAVAPVAGTNHTAATPLAGAIPRPRRARVRLPAAHPPDRRRRRRRGRLHAHVRRRAARVLAGQLPRRARPVTVLVLRRRQRSARRGRPLRRRQRPVRDRTGGAAHPPGPGERLRLSEASAGQPQGRRDGPALRLHRRLRRLLRLRAQGRHRLPEPAPGRNPGRHLAVRGPADRRGPRGGPHLRGLPVRGHPRGVPRGRRLARHRAGPADLRRLGRHGPPAAGHPALPACRRALARPRPRHLPRRHRGLQGGAERGHELRGLSDQRGPVTRAVRPVRLLPGAAPHQPGPVRRLPQVRRPRHRELVPERFLRITRDGVAEAKPIKGTAPRGAPRRRTTGCGTNWRRTPRPAPRT